MPPFENVVADAEVIVTPEEATCGLRSTTEYCIQTQGIYRECRQCTNAESNEENAHPPKYLTDQHTEHSQTWWQSVTMREGVHRNDVNLTVNLGTRSCRTYNVSNLSSPSFSYKLKKISINYFATDPHQHVIL